MKRKALIVGVANERSLAWSIAQELHKQGVELAFTYLGESLERRVRPLAESVGALVEGVGGDPVGQRFPGVRAR